MCGIEEKAADALAKTLGDDIKNNPTNWCVLSDSFVGNYRELVVKHVVAEIELRKISTKLTVTISNDVPVQLRYRSSLFHNHIALLWNRMDGLVCLAESNSIDAASSKINAILKRGETPAPVLSITHQPALPQMMAEARKMAGAVG